MTVAAVILAAGSGSRFGGGKLTAILDDRPLLAHVVEAARAAGLAPIVVVVPRDDPSIAALDLGSVRRVVNPMPAEGLSSSVRLGLRTLELEDGVDAAVILPGDQPRIEPEVIRALLTAAAQRPSTPFVIARHRDGVPNPILARRSIWRLADELVGDRGFGPILATHPELVREVSIDGTNPDVDTPGDLDRLREAGVSGSDVS
jgi:CTP:molybdopterin cytidylyltransferase MocA